MEPLMALNSLLSCLCLSSAAITGVCHCVWLEPFLKPTMSDIWRHMQVLSLAFFLLLFRSWSFFLTNCLEGSNLTHCGSWWQLSSVFGGKCKNGVFIGPVAFLLRKQWPTNSFHTCAIESKCWCWCGLKWVVLSGGFGQWCLRAVPKACSDPKWRCLAPHVGMEFNGDSDLPFWASAGGFNVALNTYESVYSGPNSTLACLSIGPCSLAYSFWEMGVIISYGRYNNHFWLS